MKPTNSTVQLVGLLTVLVRLGVHAQLVNDGATRTLNNVATNINGTVTIGTNGSFTLLVLTNGTLLTNSGNGVIGRNTGANSNTVRMTSANTRWLMSLDLFAGSNGAFNRLIVSNGARVENSFSSIGTFGSNNEATVTGSGSLWSNRNDLYVGYFGRGNGLVVTNGGLVTDFTGSLGVDTASISNETVVTGSGSLWSNRGSVFVGFQGAGNRLVVTNGGTVFASNGVIAGLLATSTNNRVVVDGGTVRVANATGTGVLEPRRGNIQFDAGLMDADLLVITNSLGKIVFAGGTLVTRGMVTANSSFTVGLNGNGGIWDVRNGASSHFVDGSIQVGNFGSGNQLVITNGALLTNNGVGLLGVKDGDSGNIVVVAGAGSQWRLSGNLAVGSTGTGNTLVVSNAAFVANSSGYVGNGGGGNKAIVTGAGAFWTNRNDFFVGNDGDGNHLVVSNGGMLANSEGLIGVLGNNNDAVVTGANSVWTHNSSLVVGSEGSGNRLEILNGGTVLSSDGSIGTDVSTVSNSVSISGADSKWTSTGNVNVGVAGRGHSLVISNQARLRSATANVGYFDTATNNTVLLTGAGSSWTNSGLLSVGWQGIGGRVRVETNALLSTVDLEISSRTNSRGNVVEVFNSGRLEVLDRVIVGVTGAVNRLIVSDGVFLGNESVFLGIAPASTNNEVVVTGPGSFWSNRFSIWVGEAGAGNRLVISNGATVLSAGGVLSARTTSTGNEAVVTGAGSLWTNSAGIDVGDSGTGNRLVVSNAATVHVSDTVFLGMLATASNNSIVVNGGTLRVTNASVTGLLDIRRGTNQLSAGRIEADRLLVTNSLGVFAFNGGLLVTRAAVISNSAPFALGLSGSTPAIWDVRVSSSNHVLRGSLIVGSNTPFNQLLITNGALLSTFGNGEIGWNLAAKSNTVFLAGAGSRWVMETDLHLGTTGAVNRLVVSNGALLYAEIASMGGSISSSNNEAVVTGAGSLWSNSVFLVVGSGSRGNRLTVTNGGTVHAGNGVFIGGNPSSTNNFIIVDGGFLRATNVSHSAALDMRGGTNVLLSGVVEVDRLRATNLLGGFLLSGGLLMTENTTYANGGAFFVGNGTSVAELNLVGSGTHTFPGGLTVRSNASLTGNGTVLTGLTVQSGGILAPGDSVGKLILLNPPLLQGQTIMEISKNGSTLTNDQVQLAGMFTYGGTLTVPKLGPTALSAGDQFPLFNAGSYGGSFSSLTLPPLAAGLAWTNKLTVNGSIQVIGSSGPTFGNVTLSGTDLIFSGTGGPTNATYWVLASTNVALPLTNWPRLLTNQFNVSGNFAFTNAISPAVPQRFYTLQVP